MALILIGLTGLFGYVWRRREIARRAEPRLMNAPGESCPLREGEAPAEPRCRPP